MGLPQTSQTGVVSEKRMTPGTSKVTIKLWWFGGRGLASREVMSVDSEGTQRWFEPATRVQKKSDYNRPMGVLTEVSTTLRRIDQADLFKTSRLQLRKSFEVESPKAAQQPRSVQGKKVKGAKRMRLAEKRVINSHKKKRVKKN